MTDLSDKLAAYEKMVGDLRELCDKVAGPERYVSNNIAVKDVLKILDRHKAGAPQGCGCPAFAMDSEGNAECAKCGHKASRHGIPGCVGASQGTAKSEEQ